MTDISELLAMVPPHMQEGLKNYIVHGIMPGNFLRSVLENNLMMAFAHADHVNSSNMHMWAAMLLNMPNNMYGSPEIITAWCKSGGTSDG